MERLKIKIFNREICACAACHKLVKTFSFLCKKQRRNEAKNDI